MKEDYKARMKTLQENGDGRVDTKGVAVFSQVRGRVGEQIEEQEGERREEWVVDVGVVRGRSCERS